MECHEDYHNKKKLYFPAAKHQLSRCSVIGIIRQFSYTYWTCTKQVKVIIIIYVKKKKKNRID